MLQWNVAHTNSQKGGETNSTQSNAAQSEMQGQKPQKWNEQKEGNKEKKGTLI